LVSKLKASRVAACNLHDHRCHWCPKSITRLEDWDFFVLMISCHCRQSSSMSWQTLSLSFSSVSFRCSRNFFPTTPLCAANQNNIMDRKTAWKKSKGPDTDDITIQLQNTHPRMRIVVSTYNLQTFLSCVSLVTLNPVCWTLQHRNRNRIFDIHTSQVS